MTNRTATINTETKSYLTHTLQMYSTRYILWFDNASKLQWFLKRGKNCVNLKEETTNQVRSMASYPLLKHE